MYMYVSADLLREAMSTISFGDRHTHNCPHISGTYSVDVADGGGWEVIVDDHVDSHEVNPSTHQISTQIYTTIS